jgi:putative transcriptional regulator
MRFKIDDILKERNSSRYRLAKQTGISEQALGKICRNETSSIEFSTIEKICKALNCTPNDIIIFDDPQLQRLLAYHSKLSELSNKK